MFVRLGALALNLFIGSCADPTVRQHACDLSDAAMAVPMRRFRRSASSHRAQASAPPSACSGCSAPPCARLRPGPRRAHRRCGGNRRPAATEPPVEGCQGGGRPRLRGPCRQPAAVQAKSWLFVPDVAAASKGLPSSATRRLRSPAAVCRPRS
jgi:hypothetical protein